MDYRSVAASEAPREHGRVDFLSSPGYTILIRCQPEARPVQARPLISERVYCAIGKKNHRSGVSGAMQVDPWDTYQGCPRRLGF